MRAAPMVGLGRIWPIDRSRATPLRALSPFCLQLQTQKNEKLFTVSQ